MNFGIYLPNYGDAISGHSLSELAHAAEQAGWDGIFLFDHILVSKNQGHHMVDPWVALAAMAMTTSRIRIGTTLTPLARRRPWKVARETVTLDHLSEGRLILTVGLGEPEKAEFAYFGEETDRHIRAEKLDEGLDILTGLWSGKPFSYAGKHYQIEKVRFQPATLQKPRIPIWVGGYWPNKAPFRRAARWDGAFPLKHGGAMTAKDFSALKAFIEQERASDTPFDLVTMGYLQSMDETKQSKTLQAYSRAGVTWWLESLFQLKNSYYKMAKLIEQGPPGRWESR
jgi:alkanesulfonate monooxygenase SsuD/methylene tetrahydromethanopterin reductase-like flavin-dependent oxidoreductase (luciferase family)